MDISSIVLMAGEVAGVLNKLLAQLPTRDQRVMSEFYKFLDTYHKEISRQDADHDDIIMWKERKELLMDTVIKGLNK